jgi:hypothetical protein
MTPATVPDIQAVPEDRLRFDDQNPRVAEEEKATQRDLLFRLWRDFAVDELALSIAANGFFQHEPLFASEENGALVVIEGNRRLAAVRLLRDAQLRKEVGATDLPRISKARREELTTLPVVICPREDIWQYVGFKHVNGPQPWRSDSKAQYIAWVHNSLDVSLEDIAEQIGDRHRTVRRLYRALMVLEQAESAGVFDVEDRWSKRFSFSHLYTSLDYKGVEKYLGIKKDRSYKPGPVPKGRVKELGQLLRWLYGSKSLEQEPLIRSQNPDLKRLDDVLLTKNGTAALERGLGLTVASEIGRGDDALLRQALLDAKQALQEARGKLLTGYEGDRDLQQLGEQILDLAEDIDQGMREWQSRGERPTSAGRSRRSKKSAARA